MKSMMIKLLLEARICNASDTWACKLISLSHPTMQWLSVVLGSEWMLVKARDNMRA
jgi:hypothetical protein